jgi:hypothetical protein
MSYMALSPTIGQIRAGGASWNLLCSAAVSIGFRSCSTPREGEQYERNHVPGRERR